MVREISYNTISDVIESWEQLRRIKNYDEVAGVKLFQRLFTECSEAKILFGFPMDIDPNSAELLNSKRFAAHSAYLIQMIDTALNMLGPDIEMLTEIMADLGAKHIRYGVKAHMFPIMGRCLIATLEEVLPMGQFSPTVKEAWVETYDALSADLIKAVNKDVVSKKK